MTLTNNKQTRKKWLIFFLVFPQIRPTSIVTLFPFISTLYTLGSIVSFVFVALFLVTTKKLKFHLTTVLIIAMELWIFFVTVIHKSQSISNNLFSFISSIAIPLIIYYYSDSMDELLSALMMNYEWLMYASLISIIMFFPNGMYISGNARQYFLGNENGIVFYAIPAMFLAFIHIKRKRRYFRGVILIAVCLANEIIVWCATAVVGIAVSGLLIIISARKKKMISYFTVFLGTLVADVLITIVRLFDRFWFTLYLIQEVLGKSLTLSRRTFIWDNALSLIPSCLGSGMGRGDHVLFRETYFHAHNEFFQILLVGGIPLLIIFFILLIHIGKVINKNNHVSFSRMMVMAMMTCLLIQFIATSRLTFRLYVPLMLGSYVNEIDRLIIGCSPQKRLKSVRLRLSSIKNLRC